MPVSLTRATFPALREIPSCGSGRSRARERQSGNCPLRFPSLPLKSPGWRSGKLATASPKASSRLARKGSGPTRKGSRGERPWRCPPGPIRPSSTCSGSAFPRSGATRAAGPGSAGPGSTGSPGRLCTAPNAQRRLGRRSRGSGRARSGARGGAARGGGAVRGRWEVASRRARAAARGRRIRTAEGARAVRARRDQREEEEDEEHGAPQHFAKNNKEAQTGVTPGGERRPAGEEGEGRGRGEAAAAPGSPGALLPLVMAAAAAVQPALKRDAFSLDVLACAPWSTLSVAGCQATPNGAFAGPTGSGEAKLGGTDDCSVCLRKYGSAGIAALRFAGGCCIVGL